MIKNYSRSFSQALNSQLKATRSTQRSESVHDFIKEIKQKHSLSIDELSSAKETAKLGQLCLTELQETGISRKDRVTARYISSIPSVLIKIDSRILDHPKLWTQY